MKTYQQKLVKGLLALGWKQDEATSGKYITFSKSGNNSKLFLGSSGALRVGRNPSNSRSIGNPSSISGFYKKILDAAETQFPSVSSTLTTQNQNLEVMSKKTTAETPEPTAPVATVADIVVNPSTKAPTIKKGENPLDIARKAREVMQGQLLLVGGEIQHKLKSLLDDFNSLKEFGMPINWGDPSYFPYLTDLGLQPISNDAPTTKRGRKPAGVSADGNVSYGEGTVKYKVMECLKDGKVKDLDTIAKDTKLDKAKLAVPLGQMVNKDGTIKRAGRGEFQIK